MWHAGICDACTCTPTTLISGARRCCAWDASHAARRCRPLGVVKELGVEEALTRRVLGVGRAAVLDADALGDRGAALLGDPLADGLVRLLRLVRRGGDAGADGPDRLVRDHNLGRVEQALDALELLDALGEDSVDALLADGQGLANGKDDLEALLEGVGALGGEELVRLGRRRQAELATTLRVATASGEEGGGRARSGGITHRASRIRHSTAPLFTQGKAGRRGSGLRIVRAQMRATVRLQARGRIRT